MNTKVIPLKCDIRLSFRVVPYVWRCDGVECTIDMIEYPAPDSIDGGIISDGLSGVDGALALAEQGVHLGLGDT